MSLLTDPIQKKIIEKFPNIKEIELDVFIITQADRGKIEASYDILSASSSYFKKKLEKNPRAIEIPDINTTDMDSIWEFMLTAKIEINSKNVKTIIVAANLFQMEGLIKLCNQALLDLLKPNQTVDYLDIVCSIFKKCTIIPSVKKKYYNYLFNHELYTSEKLCSFFNKTDLEAFLDCVNKDKTDEQNNRMFQCLTCWFEYTKQKNEMDKLMTRFVDLDKLKGKSIVLKWNMEHELPDIQRDKILIAYQSLDRLYVRTYDTDREIWEKEDFFNLIDDYTTTYLTDRLMYFSEVTNVGANVSCLNIELRNTSKLAPMRTARSGHCMVEVNEYLYIVGGKDRKKNLVSSIERYNSSTNKWTEVASLPEGFQCSKVSAANGRLYVYTPAKKYLACYNPSKNEWTWTAEIPSNAQKQTTFCLTTVNGFLFMIGDNHFFQFNPVKDKWKEGKYGGKQTSYNKVRACTAWNDRLLLLDSSEEIKILEFDDSWKQLSMERVLMTNVPKNVDAYISVYKSKM